MPGESVQSIRRIRADRSVDDFPVRAGAGISDLMGAPDGNIVFTESSKDRLGRLTAGGGVEELALPPSLDGPVAMTIGADGAVFFATRRAVARWIADGTYQEFRADAIFAGRSPHIGFTSITASADGTLWLAVPAELRTSGGRVGGAIVRMTPDGTFSEVVRLAPLVSPSFVTAGKDGSIWFTVQSDYPQLSIDERLVRRRPDGTVDDYSLPPAPDFSYPRAAGIVIDESGVLTLAVNYMSGGAALAQLQLDDMK